MQRQGVNLYPDIDLSPIPPRREFSSNQKSRRPLRPCRSFSSGDSLLGKSLVVPPPTMKDLSEGAQKREREWTIRRQNSANNLSMLAVAPTPKRGSLTRETEPDTEAEDRRSRRRSRGDTLPSDNPTMRRRHRSVDDMRRRLSCHEDEDDRNSLEPQGRRVIKSLNSPVPDRRRGRSRDPAASRRDQGVPGSIKIVRGHSCGGRLPSAYQNDKAPYCRERNESGATGIQSSNTGATTEDDDSSSTSSIDDFDNESMGLPIAASATATHQKITMTRTHVSGLTNEVSWRHSDGSVMSTSSPEQRAHLERTLSEAMSSLTQGTAGRGKQLGDDSKRTAATAPSSGYCGSSVSSAPAPNGGGHVYHGGASVHGGGGSVHGGAPPYGAASPYGGASVHGGASVYSGISNSQMHHQPVPAMMRPWICLCGEDNDPDFNFCGQCAAPAKWTCGHCEFPRNKNRSPHCGGCGKRRDGSFRGPAMMGNSSRTQQTYNHNQGHPQYQPQYQHPNQYHTLAA